MIESKETDERYTPREYLEVWRDFFGPRFTDISNTESNVTGAEAWFSAKHPAPGARAWMQAAEESGSTWLYGNVPYSRGMIMKFVRMAAAHWTEGRWEIPMVWLLPVDPSAHWSQLLYEMGSWLAFPRRRLRFGGSEGVSGAKQPSQFVVMGGEPGARAHFATAYGSLFCTAQL